MSKILYSALRTPGIKTILHDLQEASNELGIDFFGIGALARNVWFISNNEQARGTKDVDFAVYVPTLERYQALRDKLVSNYSYTSIPTNEYRLISPPPNQIAVDLIPFEMIAEQESNIVSTKSILSNNFEGLPEVYLNGLVDATIEEHAINVCSIPSVVILKLISYDDRPENRPNDPIDINSILSYYPELEMEMIWEEYTFLYETDQEALSPYDIGIKVLGYEIAKIIGIKPQLLERVLDILNRAINLQSNLAQQMIQDSTKETVEDKCNSLTLIKQGIEEQVANFS
jgi:predicted nucleotidyltransferase